MVERHLSVRMLDREWEPLRLQMEESIPEQQEENKTAQSHTLLIVDVLLGLQWGDEGKGKVVDVLTPKYDVVARFQGGPNAGHTLEFEGQKYVLRSIPSGIFLRDHT